MRKNIIITADDFGKSAKANRNILELVKMKKLDRVAVMVDGKISQKEKEELMDSGVEIDIHLELDWQKKRRNLLEDNTFHQGMVFLRNYFFCGGKKKVFAQWAEQIGKFHQIFGQYPDGINSHEYVHLFPSYFSIALELSKKYGIRYIRIGRRGFLGSRNLASLTLGILRKMDISKLKQSEVSSSDFFTSLDWIRGMDKFLEDLPDGETEIAVHPEREEELEMIKKYF